MKTGSASFLYIPINIVPTSNNINV